MQSFDIVKKSDIERTFRVAHVMADYDVKVEHADEHFVGTIEMPEEWKIGVIVGPSGTGKTTIAKELFPEFYVTHFEYTHKSVIDDMPQDIPVADIEKTFYSVGFGSVPSWLKPYNVLSNGEKMRVDLARAILEKDFFVFDEFTSVVDRNVAKTACIAINKAMNYTNKRFIAVSCHYDILEWLQPDWVLDTSDMRSFFTNARDRKNGLPLHRASVLNGQSLGDIII